MIKELELLSNFVGNVTKDCKVLVIGDVMLDKYYFGEVKRISSEAPVPITRVQRQKETLGGAANVAHNLALMGCQTYLAGAVGDDHHRTILLEKLSERKIIHDGLICTPGPTTTKVRVMGGHQQMLRLDFEETEPIAGMYEIQFCRYIETMLKSGMDSVIISDYAKGVCTHNICQYVIKTCKQYKVPVIIDPKGHDWRKYENADYITPNLKELNEVCTVYTENEDEAVKNTAQSVRRKYKLGNIIVTRSERGLSLISAKKIVHIPTLAQEVFDVSGAGDTVIAILALALAGKLKPEYAAYLANLAASVVVAKSGTYAVSQMELIEALERKHGVYYGKGDAQ